MSSSEEELHKKYIDFVSEPMRDKPIVELPGINENVKSLLTNKGFDQAYVLLGQFLVLKKDKDMFIEWMVSTIGTKKSTANICYKALLEWSQNFLD